jgi:L-ribulose-5-phosphate 4-epimerase
VLVLEALRERVLAANLALPAHALVTLTWGNVSGIDRDRGLVAIKPSGMAYEEISAADIVLVDLDGNRVEGERRPSTDTPSHLAVYRAFESIGGIVHTHSTWATAWAQAEREIPILGTTHADLCPGPVPVTRPLSAEEVERDYEGATGIALVEAVGERAIDEVPAALARGHGPFCWAGDPARAVEVAVTLEEVARLAALTVALEPAAVSLAAAVREKHFTRKHGPRAYYGQTQ